MRNGSPVSCHWTNLIVLAFVGLLTITAVPVSHAVPQTAATGALIGEVLDPTGQGIPGASVELKNQEMAASRSTVSDEEGRFVFTLLPPGTYQVTVQKDGYSQAKSAVSVSDGDRPAADSAKNCRSDAKRRSSCECFRRANRLIRHGKSRGRQHGYESALGHQELHANRGA